MKELDIRVPVCSMGYDELDDDTRRLVDTAREYTHHSYAPYSHFSVGAAIRLDNGEIVVSIEDSGQPGYGGFPSHNFPL